MKPLSLLLLSLALTTALLGCDSSPGGSANVVDNTPDAQNDTSDAVNDDVQEDQMDAQVDTGMDTQEDVPAPPECEEDRLGESSPQAPLGLTGSRILGDLVACPQGADWFSLTVQPGDRLGVTVVGEIDDLTVALLDIDTETLLDAERQDDRLRLVFQADQDQQVLLRVANGTDTALAYDLTVALDRDDTPEDCLETPEEPNDTPQEAFAIDDPTAFSLDTALCPADVDWYQVTMAPGETFTAQIGFDHDEGDLDMRIWLRGQEEPLGTSESTADVERLQAGPFEQEATVLVEVYGFRDASAPYTLQTTLFGAAERESTVQGSLQYEDRPYDIDGFTGELVPTGLQHAVVEVVRDFDGAVVGRGTTTEGGAFEVTFGVHDGQTYQVRALAAVEVPGNGVTYRARVQDRTDSRAIYAVTSDSFDADATPLPRFDLLATASSPAGGAMNIMDVTVAGFAFVAQHSSQEAPTLTYRWQAGQAFGCGSCYSDNTVSLGGQVEDTDEYDDHIVLHEFGHYFVQRFSNDDSPGGPHRDRQVSPRLAYGEGVAYFFCGMVLDRADVVDTFMDDVRVIDMEAVTQNGQPQDNMFGTDDGSLGGDLREEVIAGILWDALDPASPDEPFDTVEIGPDGHMDLLLDYFGQGIPVDVGPSGIDLTDWLNAFHCSFPQLQGALPPLVEDRQFPWEPEEHTACGQEKGRDQAPFAIEARPDGLWLVAKGDHGFKPGTVNLWQGSARPTASALHTCNALPCQLTQRVDHGQTVAVTTHHDGAWVGTSWVGQKAAKVLLGGQSRVQLSSLGPVRAYSATR